MEFTKPSIRITTDPADIDINRLHSALSERANRALGRGRYVVERSTNLSTVPSGSASRAS